MPTVSSCKGNHRVTNSRAQDAAAVIKQAQIDVENASLKYRRGGSVDELNAANRKLAAAHNRLYEIDGGVVRDDR